MKLDLTNVRMREQIKASYVMWTRMIPYCINCGEGGDILVLYSRKLVVVGGLNGFECTCFTAYARC